MCLAQSLEKHMCTVLMSKCKAKPAVYTSGCLSLVVGKQADTRYLH